MRKGDSSCFLKCANITSFTARPSVPSRSFFRASFRTALTSFLHLVIWLLKKYRSLLPFLSKSSFSLGYSSTLARVVKCDKLKTYVKREVVGHSLPTSRMLGKGFALMYSPTSLSALESLSAEYIQHLKLLFPLMMLMFPHLDSPLAANEHTHDCRFLKMYLLLSGHHHHPRHLSGCVCASSDRKECCLDSIVLLWFWADL